MIVVDTSALLAVLQAEKEGEEFLDLLVHNRLYLPASVLVEISIVALGRALTKDLRELVANLRAEVIALDSGIASFAIDAFRRFGKGRHQASLNFGDCLVYATAKQLDLPLLYKGRDFLYTDLKSAIPARQ